MSTERAGLRLIVFEPFTLWDTVRALSGASVFLVEDIIEDIVTVRIGVAEVCGVEEGAGAGSCAAIGVDLSRGNGRSGVAHHSESWGTACHCISIFGVAGDAPAADSCAIIWISALAALVSSSGKAFSPPVSH